MVDHVMDRVGQYSVERFKGEDILVSRCGYGSDGVLGLDIVVVGRVKKLNYTYDASGDLVSDVERIPESDERSNLEGFLERMFAEGFPQYTERRVSFLEQE